MTHGILDYDTSYDSPLVLICQLTDFQHVPFPSKEQKKKGRKESSGVFIRKSRSHQLPGKDSKSLLVYFSFFSILFLAALNVCSLGQGVRHWKAGYPHVEDGSDVLAQAMSVVRNQIWSLHLFVYFYPSRSHFLDRLAFPFLQRESRRAVSCQGTGAWHQ